MTDASFPSTLPLFRRSADAISLESIDAMARGFIATLRHAGVVGDAFYEFPLLVEHSEVLGEHSQLDEQLNSTHAEIERLVTDELLSSGVLHEAFRRAANTYTAPVREAHVTVEDLRLCAGPVTRANDPLHFLELLEFLDKSSTSLIEIGAIQPTFIQLPRFLALEWAGRNDTDGATQEVSSTRATRADAIGEGAITRWEETKYSAEDLRAIESYVRGYTRAARFGCAG